MIFDFTKRPYMSQICRVDLLQRVVLIHSILYYSLNQTLISDSSFDELCWQLIDETKQLSQAQQVMTDYWYVMYDFDGTTGFDLPGRLNSNDKKKLGSIAISLLQNERGDSHR